MSFPAHLQRPAGSRVHRLVMAGVLAAAVGLPACSSGFGSFAAPVAAVVGGKAITEADVVGQIRLALTAQSNGQQLLASLTGGTGARQTALATKRDMLTSLIQLEVVRVQGRKMGITARAADVRAATSRVTAQTAFVRQLAANGASVGDISTYEATHLVLNEVHAAVTKDIAAAPEQIAAAYAANKATYDANYHAAHILICSRSDSSGRCADNPADAAKATSIAQQAAAGADFGQLAARYSVDRGSATKGGDLGWVSPGQLVPEFEHAALALKPGEITAQPVKSQFGYHIIKLIDKGESLADASASINNSLEQTAVSSAFDAWLSNAIAHTTIKVNPIFGTFNPRTSSVVAPPGAAPPPTNPGLGGP